jgi:hypothetical protein
LRLASVDCDTEKEIEMMNDKQQIPLKALYDFCDKVCLGKSNLIACAESAFYTFNNALNAQQAKQEPVAMLNIALDKIKQLPRFSFLSPKEGGVVKCLDKSGRWIEQYECVKVLDDILYSFNETSPPNQDAIVSIDDGLLTLYKIPPNQEAEIAELKARVRELVYAASGLLDKLSFDDDEGLLEYVEPVIKLRNAIANTKKGE